MKTNIQRDFNR